MSRKSNMAERCRICLSNHGCMIDLHDETVEGKLKDLTKCTSIDVKYEENLPSVVCHVCLYKLDMWSEFKEQFIQSNKILLEQLEISEASDISDSAKDSHKDERCVTENMKRKRLNRSEDSISDKEKKKSKADVSSSELTNVDRDTGQIILDVISLSDDNDKTEGPTLSKDFSQKVDDPDNTKKAAENSKEHIESKAASGPVRARLLPARRGRNIERRKASTKRWVERKKALLAATGENISDTDSIISDDAQLSPVQKARAKNNADKEAERQKRIAKVLKNLEMNLTEKYTAIHRICDRDTDSDARRTRFSNLQANNKNSLSSPTNKKNSAEKNISSLKSSIEQENSPVPLENNTTDPNVKKLESQVDDEPFAPCTLKSELVIGDVTYAVTSMLILADKESSNNITDSKNSNVDENNHEKNTDIIDAVQLRRVNNPVTLDVNRKSDNTKSVERCLNIEVEGNELAILKRVQVELADFVQKEMRHRIFGTNDSVAKTLFPDKLDDVSAISRQKLDQKLKGIIERSIKKNIESSIRNADDTCGFTKVSSAVTKAVMNLPEYQPKVVIKRLNIPKESKLYKINNLHVLKQAAPRGSSHGGSINLTSRKRQIVPPRRYNDYNTSALDSDSENSNMISPKGASKTSTGHVRTHENSGRKKSPGMNRQVVIPVKRVENNSIVKVTDNGAKWTPLFVEQKSTNEQKADYEDAIRIEGAITENHICGVCALTFSSRKEVEAHVRTHKIMTSANVTQVTTLQNENVAATLPRPNKQKMMRCKRCHEIVEARFVKSHICKTATEVHKCYVCNSMFRTEKLLVRHLESHDQSEFNIVNAIGNKKSNTVDISQTTQSATPQEDQKTETVMKMQNLSTEKNDQSDIQSDKITSTGVKLDSAENIAEKSKETYTCFVCDKIFTDEEVLKDHLQKHCDDLSEGEQSNSKEQFQCAICGDTLESDQALEEHVGKHLFDDEDDNPNLISINQDNKNNNETKGAGSYRCGQCSESFDLEMLLEMHMQEHAEEIAIAEWEKQGMRVINQYQCMLCDELFDVEEDLTEHLDIHNANAHVCQLCDKPFRTLEDLQEHVATH